MQTEKKKNVSGLDRPLPPQGPWVVLLFLHRFHAPACVDTITEDAEEHGYLNNIKC